MLVDEGALERRGRHVAVHRASSSDVDVPPTIQALLAARLDTLEPEERSVIEPASVVGHVFAEAAVAALAPPDVVADASRPSSRRSTHKHLVHARSTTARTDAHRFHHILIRDTAYDGILKRARADLHERFVAWADGVNRDRGRRVRGDPRLPPRAGLTYLSELGPLDDRGREIGADGARRLASAGRRAFARGDIPGAAILLGRAAALLPDDRDRLRAAARVRRGAPA